MKVQNRQCRQRVTNCQPFTGSNLSGVRVSGKLYVVYSYGHYPLWAKINNQWYGHTGKYSSTTSAHQSGSRPESNNIHMLDSVKQLKENIAAVS